MRKTRQVEMASVYKKRRPKLLLTAILCILSAAVLLICTSCKTAVDNTAATEAVDAAADATEPSTEPPFDPLNFTTAEVPDDGTDGYYSTVNPGVYIYQNMAFELSGASDEMAKDYAFAISQFKAEAPNVTVYNMVIPTHAEFGLPKRLLENGVYSADQKNNIKTVYSSYTEDVKPINCYNTLAEHMKDYIYFNTDHHWTGLGAYYAYQAFCEQTDQTALQLSDCTEKTIEGFEGTFTDCAESLSQNLDTVHYWEFPYKTHAMRQEETGQEPYEMEIYYPYIEPGPGVYSTFICGDSSLFIEYNDELKNGRKIAVVKESFGNAFVPYLTYNYEEVHVIDFRYFGENLKDYLQNNGIDEIIFVNNTMSANAAVSVDMIRSLF